MAVHLADFVAIKIGSDRMGAGRETRRKFVFSLPEAVSGLFPLIVTFVLLSSNDLEMRIEFNGTVISDRQYTNGPERSIQEFANHVSFTTAGNELSFTVLRGEISLRDVILWFQRGI